MSVNDQSNVQNLYSQYQAATRQIQYYEQQEIQLFSVLEELTMNLQTLKGLEEYSENSHIIIPLGGIILVNAKLKEIKEVLLNIGSEIVVPTSIELH